jgi:hypothetical protein
MSLKVIKLNIGVVPSFILNLETVILNYLRIVAVADVMSIILFHGAFCFPRFAISFNAKFYHFRA